MDYSVEQKFLNCLREIREHYKLNDIEELEIVNMELVQLTERCKQELEKLVYLQGLIFTQCQLKSLDNLPFVDSLNRIYFDHNQLSGKELGKLSKYPNLIAVSVIDNKFESIEDIKQLALCPHLCQINLYKNPVSDQPKLRNELFECIPTLIFLDNIPKNGDEIGLNAAIKISKPMT
ncbi:hypothetical protein pb186bvf_012595 [Paramecium bursaria]